MNVLQSMILGLIQGITEFIPVSSSGHLTLFGRIFNVDSSLMLSYTTLLHIGTLISVFIVMRKDLLDILRDIFGRMTWLLVVATIPAVVAALLMGDFIEEMFAGNTLGYQFLLTGVILLSTLFIREEGKKKPTVRTSGLKAKFIDNVAGDDISKTADSTLDDNKKINLDQDLSIEESTENTKNTKNVDGENKKLPTETLKEEISYKEAFIAGLGQAVAILPGISRSGSTLAALLFCRIERKKAVRFAFLMSIPAIVGGFALDLLKMFKGNGSALTAINPFVLLVGVVAAFLSGWLAMNFMLKKLTKKGLLNFSIYVIILGFLVLLDQNILHLVFKV